MTKTFWACVTCGKELGGEEDDGTLDVNCLDCMDKRIKGIREIDNASWEKVDETRERKAGALRKHKEMVSVVRAFSKQVRQRD